MWWYYSLSICDYFNEKFHVNLKEGTYQLKVYPKSYFHVNSQ